MVSDRFSGMNRAFINPAYLFDSHYCLEFSPAIFHVGGQNNLFYFPRGRFNIDDLYREAIGRNGFSREDLMENEGTYAWGNQYLRMQGPSVGFRINEHHFSISTGYRSVGSGRHVPYHLIKFALEEFEFPPLQDIPVFEDIPMHIYGIGWLEIGASYATLIYDGGSSFWAAGITLKGLFANYGIALSSEAINYEISSSRHLTITNSSATLHAAIPVDYQTREINPTGNWAMGRGYQLDLGVSYTHDLTDLRGRNRKRLNHLPDFPNYRYKVGFSLLDVGNIRLTRNIRQFIMDDATLFWENPQLNTFDNADQFFSELDSRLETGTITRIENEPFRVYLPTAVSLQGDYHVSGNFFAYAFITQNLPHSGFKVARPSQLGFVPRLETPFFSLMLPITLLNYELPRMGMAARVGPVTIGAEQPGGLFNTNDFYGLDFYIALRWGILDCGARYRGNPCFN